MCKYRKRIISNRRHFASNTFLHNHQPGQAGQKYTRSLHFKSRFQHRYSHIAQNEFHPLFASKAVQQERILCHSAGLRWNLACFLKQPASLIFSRLCLVCLLDLPCFFTTIFTTSLEANNILKQLQAPLISCLPLVDLSQKASKAGSTSLPLFLPLGRHFPHFNQTDLIILLCNYILAGWRNFILLCGGKIEQTSLSKLIRHLGMHCKPCIQLF